jgi:hypothetical protein
MARNGIFSKIEKFPAAKQRRMDALLDKNREGTITPKELAVLEKLVAEAETLMVENSKRLAKCAQQNHAPPPGAVPVTVWVSPASAPR